MKLQKLQNLHFSGYVSGFGPLLQQQGQGRLSIRRIKLLAIEGLDCKTVVGFFLKISKEIGKAWHKSLARAKRSARASHALREKKIF